MSDDELSSGDIEQLDAMLGQAEDYYFRKGYSPREAYKRAVEVIYEETGCAPRIRGSRGGRIDRFSEWLDAAFGPLPSVRLACKPLWPYTEEPSSDTQRRRTKQSSCSTQSGLETEFDPMFQGGRDRNAAQNSGRLLSNKKVKLGEWQIIRDLIEKGADPDYARQQGEQFAIREIGKRAQAALEAAGLPSDDDVDERNKGRGGGRQKYGRSEFDEYGGYETGAEERYSTSHNYTDKELRIIEAKIYYEWIERGARSAKARQEAKKWFNRNKGRGTKSSSRRSGFDSFNDMREALDDDGSNVCRSHSSREPRAGKIGAWNDRKFDQCFTHKPVDDFRHSSGRGPHGYRTEERRPGGSSSGNYNSFDNRSGWHGRHDEPMEPSGIKPDEDLYVLLGVSKRATVDEIKAAHRKLCIKHHPDRAKGGPAAKKAATEKMAQFNQAWDVLKETNMRAFYDRTGLIASVGTSPDA